MLSLQLVLLNGHGFKRASRHPSFTPSQRTGYWNWTLARVIFDFFTLLFSLRKVLHSLQLYRHLVHSLVVFLGLSHSANGIDSPKKTTQSWGSRGRVQFGWLQFRLVKIENLTALHVSHSWSCSSKLLNSEDLPSIRRPVTLCLSVCGWHGLEVVLRFHWV